MPVSSLIIHLLVGIALASPANNTTFPDVYSSDAHVAAITWMAGQSIVKGYTDGSFRPDRKVNRAEAIKMIVVAKGLQDETKTCTTASFNDTTDSDWFTPYVCVAVKQGWVDASTDETGFRPSEWINAGEVSVLLARVYALETGPSDPWYASAVDALGAKHAIPTDIQAAGESVTRAELAEMLWRLETSQKDVSSADPQKLLDAVCDWQPIRDIPHVDDQEVDRAWMTWVNGLRTSLDFVPYHLDAQLSKTAQEWADHAKESGAISHKRAGQTAFYDYNRMTDWFAARDLTFENDDRSTFTENIGWGVYSCSKADCTQNLINALRTTFDFYMSEKGKPSRAHYNSMVNTDFRLAGIGIAVDEASGKYYVTVHYGTAITSDPDPVCP